MTTILIDYAILLRTRLGVQSGNEGTRSKGGFGRGLERWRAVRGRGVVGVDRSLILHNIPYQT